MNEPEEPTPAIELITFVEMPEGPTLHDLLKQHREALARAFYPDVIISREKH